MKFALLAILAVTLYLGVSCSPVHFNTVDHKCTVASPCITAQGQNEVGQDFPFYSSNKVDVLVVDDNSGSMTTEQNNLGTPFNGFISGLNQAGLQWQVGITNTDICPNAGAPAGFCPGPSNINGAQGSLMNQLNSSPRYGNFILTPNTPNVSSVFQNTVQRGSEIGSGDERGIYAAVLATANKGALNPGFLRDQSNLAVVILSDEDERSVGGNCTPQTNGQCDPGYAPLETNDLPQTLITQINTDWAGAKKLTAYSIVIQSGDANCLAQQKAQGPYNTAHYGTVYESLSQMTGGIVGSICDNGSGAFQKVLNQITGDIINQNNTNVITLAYSAKAQPTVTFNPAGNGVGWNWNGSNQITFTTHPIDGTTVHVDYVY